MWTKPGLKRLSGQNTFGGKYRVGKKPCREDLMGEISNWEMTGGEGGNNCGKKVGRGEIPNTLKLFVPNVNEAKLEFKLCSCQELFFFS